MLVVNCNTQPFDAYIGRGSRFGNPFPITPQHNRAAVLQRFGEWVFQQPELLRLVRRELPGKRLGCHCAPEACHGDLLAQIATGEWDDRIEPEPIFVFGSNQAGRHGRGAARFAKQYRGAVYGVGEGPTGTAYALPTKDASLHMLPLRSILESLDALFEYADRHPYLTFQLTRVGCGLAGASPEQERTIAEKAFGAPTNVRLPGVWEAIRDPLLARVIVAGTRHFKDYRFAANKLDHLLGDLLASGYRVEIVSGGARGVDTLGERYAVERGLALRRFPAEWERFEKSAGGVRNQLMAWYGTHLVSLWDRVSPGTASMRQLGLSDGLKVRTVTLPRASPQAVSPHPP